MNQQLNYDNLKQYKTLKNSRRDCIKKIIELKNTKYFYIGATSNPNKDLMII